MGHPLNIAKRTGVIEFSTIRDYRNDYILKTNEEYSSITIKNIKEIIKTLSESDLDGILTKLPMVFNHPEFVSSQNHVECANNILDIVDYCGFWDQFFKALDHVGLLQFRKRIFFL